ncbi:type II secretion system protein GspC [Neptunicella sp. SCSIO 80796]|uniref:type II secretion system protein GspC n=1 Tax=Neptunicella plasticusilytica TaxID=3117012 RepID=UPI003A4E35A6
MFIDNYTFKQISLQLRRYQNYLPKLLVVVISLYLLNYAAILTWRLLPAPAQDKLISFTPAVNTAGNQGNQIDMAKIQRLYLFGKPGAQDPKPVVATQDAPQTNLKLTLTGVVASTQDSAGAAIVENKGQQNTYGVGDKIDGTRVTINEVFADRITINNGGKIETLMLDGVDYNKSPSIMVQASDDNDNKIYQPNEDSVQHLTLSPEVQNLRQEIADKPASFSEYISISPEQQDGKPVGYRVRPGRTPDLFNAAGLQNNDIITELNGLDLTDPQQAMEAMSSLNEAESLQLTVNRDGDLLTLYLDLPSL